MNEKGFTLVELLIVLAVLLVLSGIIVPTYTVFRGKARETATEIEMSNIVKALEFYNTNNQAYPATDSFPDVLTRNNYIKDVSTKDAWGNAYQYTSNHGKSYVLESYGLNKNDGGNDDIVFYNGTLIESGAYPN